MRQAIAAADNAFQVYRAIPPRQRRFMLRRWSDLIRAHRDDLAALCTLELGKPFSESLLTVDYGLDFIDWFESEAERIYGEFIPANRKGTKIITTREPQGVVVAITPWNSPIAMITRKACAAIAAGNTVVCKPAPETPLCAIAMAKLFDRAGFPKGTFNVVTCSAANSQAIGEEFCSNPLVKHLSFTGSTGVGRLLNIQCAKYMKKVSMELGGNAPFIIFEDANINQAVEGVISSKFRSSGQTCICANRLFVHESIADEFLEKLMRRISETVVEGSVWDRNVNYGPLYSIKGVEKVRQHIANAKAAGANVVLGGEIRSELGPNHFPPTIIKNAKPDMLFNSEETFGPLAPIIPFSSEEEVVRLANDTNVGLAGYFYTEDIARLWRVAEALQVGMVGCRVGLISACEQPFSGVKDSGFGIEGSSHALKEYVNVKSITIGGL
jgi:succinate-semialdehyde dehydrogenase/glutarate-semialdehyde dehydrogenase